MYPGILHFLLLVNTGDFREQTRRLVQQDKQEIACLLLSNDKNKDAEYFYLKAVINHKLHKKRNISNAIRNFEWLSSEETPNRYISVVSLIKEDIKRWDDDEYELGNIARDMAQVSRRLANNQPDKFTQNVQEDIVRRLDKKIKDIEDSLANASEQEQNKSQDQQAEPQKDSHIGNDSGPGNVDPKKLKHMAEGWGKLPEKEKEKAMQNLIKDLPPKHRQVVEQYFKDLARKRD